MTERQFEVHKQRADRPVFAMRTGGALLVFASDLTECDSRGIICCRKYL